MGAILGATFVEDRHFFLKEAINNHFRPAIHETVHMAYGYGLYPLEPIDLKDLIKPGSAVCRRPISLISYETDALKLFPFSKSLITHELDTKWPLLRDVLSHMRSRVSPPIRETWKRNHSEKQRAH